MPMVEINHPPASKVRKNSFGSHGDSGTAQLCQTGTSSKHTLPMINSLHKPQIREWQETFLPPTMKTVKGKQAIHHLGFNNLLKLSSIRAPVSLVVNTEEIKTREGCCSEL